MEENKNNDSFDIFGFKPFADAVDKTVQKSLEGIEGFLQLVCKPALGEIGLLLQDKVTYWRLNNIVNMLEKAKGKLDFQNGKLELKSHPRIGLSIIENSSLIDNDEIQDMWAGLFASSCTEGDSDDENLIFIELLKKLTVPQARILRYGVENSKKLIYSNGLILATKLEIPFDELLKITGVSNYHRIDRELDYLRAIGLICSYHGGFDPHLKNLVADITPTYLSLSLYVKSQGSTDNPDIYWKDELVTEEDLEKERINKNNEVIRNMKIPSKDAIKNIE